MEECVKNENSDNALAFFRKMYLKYRDQIIGHLEEFNLEESIKEYLKKYYAFMLDYNCYGGKNARGTLVILIYEYIMDRDINKTEWEKVACLAWCIEILQASFLVADDIMDNGETRRNKICWYLLKDVKTHNAINDALFMYTIVFKLLEMYLRNETYYINITGTFRDVSLKAIIGQHIDNNVFTEKFTKYKNENIIDINETNAISTSKINVHMLNSKVYYNIIIHKTGYYSFFLPIACGMLLAGIEINNLIYRKIEDISIMLGELFQITDDCLDVWGDPNVTGKKGSDIQNNRLTWPLLKTFEVCSEEDKMRIIKNYGKNNKTSIQIVKSIYENYDVLNLFKEYKKEQKEKISIAIDNIHHEGIQFVLRHVVNVMFKNDF